jgi:hypothetical protein
MKNIAAFIVCCILGQAAAGQAQQRIMIDTSAETEKYWKAWLLNLYDVGVVMEKDSIRINEEVKKIILDSNVRKSLYPPVYTWPETISLLNKLELKKGFWFLTNLYAADTANKKLVIETIIPFDKLMDMEKVMVSTFYTYAFLDPKVCMIKNGKPVVIRPDIVEKEFGQLKEIIRYIDSYRKQ